MNLRLANANDWPALKHINQVIDYGNPESFMIECVGANRVLVAEVNENITGYILWQYLWGNNPFLALLKVLPKHQKKGIGKQLLNAAEREIKAAGFENYLSSTELNNDLGKTWHKKNGFVLVGQLNMVHGEELFYKKDIA